MVEEIRKPKSRLSAHGRGTMAISIPAVRKIAIQILHEIKRVIPPKNPNLRVRKRRRFILIARNGPI